ncbi:MAG: hypothetical protein SO170_08840 [Butyribacter sp.]|nr:hypothetical protein [bacterium]MDY3855044.1 hypothetical protein [Butyribacter sp.]
MNKITKKIIAVALTIATVATSVAAVPSQSASAKAKNYNCYLMFANKKWSCVNMNEKVANTKVKNKKGKKTYTVTLKRSKCTNENKKGSKAEKAKDAQVLCVDIKDILLDHKAKNIKISNVVVKCDGKKVKVKQSKMAQGKLEPYSDPDKYRLEIYNEYGEGGTKKHPCAKLTKFKWSKKISVTFTLNIKK